MVRRSLPLLVLLLVIAAVAAEVRLGLGRDWVERQLAAPDPLTEPADVPPPEGLTLPELAAPGAVATPVDVEATDLPAAGKVRRTLAPLLDDRDLGRHVVVEVAGLGADSSIFTSGNGRVIPASTTKLLTATAALSALGPDRAFVTRVVAGRSGRNIVLVGGGDPYLASRPATDQDDAYPPRADVKSLAEATAAALTSRGRRRVWLGYDDSLFTGPSGSPQWRPAYLREQLVAPISALWVDGGRPSWGYGRVADPPAYAAELFAAALRKAGVEVIGAPIPRAAPTDAVEVAVVESAPLTQIVERMLEVSDNEAAEVLAHHVGLAGTGRGTFAGAREGVAATLDGLGVSLAGDAVYDGSGLSRRSRVRAATLLDVLQVVASPAHPELRPVVTGLPVAGFTGSLELRFEGDGAIGRGQVRAKTGTLSGVSGLAGVVTDRSGTTMVFAMVADRVALEDTLAAREALDAMAAALAACRCGRS